MKTVKGSWSRVHNLKQYGQNHDAIFKRKNRFDDESEPSSEELQEKSENIVDMAKDDGII